MNFFSTSDWIAIATCIISVFVSIILYQRVRKKKFIFLEKRHLQLNNVDFGQFNNFKILYGEEEIHDFIYSVSGTLIAIGDNDISSNDISHPLCIKINDLQGKWKSEYITEKTNLLNCNLEVDGNTLKFNTDEIKSQDYIKFIAYYNAKTKGFKFHHRILDVYHKVSIISEELRSIYVGGTILFTFLIGFIIFTIMDSSNDLDNTYKENIKFTQRVNLEKPTKEDSIIGKRYSYQELYFINSDTLKYDSILKKNKILNKTLNKNRPNLSALDSKDSLYYEDSFSISEKSDSIIYKLLNNNVKFNKNNRYRINDTISVSFINNDELFEHRAKDNNLFNISFLIFQIISVLFLSILNFTCIYNLYLLNKYKSIITANRV